MAHPAGESETGVLRLDFDFWLKLKFHGSKVTTDAGLLPFRELDDVFGLTQIAGERLVDPRTGENGQHGMSGPLRQSTFARPAGYENVNDADRHGRSGRVPRPVQEHPGADRWTTTTIPGEDLNRGDDERTEGGVCPEKAGSGEKRRPTGARRPKARFTGRKCSQASRMEPFGCHQVRVRGLSGNCRINDEHQ